MPSLHTHTHVPLPALPTAPTHLCAGRHPASLHFPSAQLALPPVSAFQGWLHAENELPFSEMTDDKGVPQAAPGSGLGA